MLLHTINKFYCVLRYTGLFLTLNRIVAYGEQWFGPESFEIAHHVIAKIGSAIALFVIAYAVMRILPEVLDMIDGLWQMTTRHISNIVQKTKDFRDVS
ncbi:hypothetical protein [Methanococcoides sp. FTZ1]|uniref:hypothetical protein n=1 Tax=Methanococcoides sp. FTZ1 TaxID=3439061 RepID=UPI003F864862